MSYASARKTLRHLPLVLILASVATVGCTSMPGAMGQPAVSIQGSLPGSLSIQVHPGAFQQPGYGYQQPPVPYGYGNPAQQYANPNQYYAYAPSTNTAGAPLTTTGQPVTTSGQPLTNVAGATPTGAIPATGVVPSPLAPVSQPTAGTAPLSPGSTATQAQAPGMQLNQNWTQYFHDNLNRLNGNDLRPQVQQALTSSYAGQALTPEQRYQVAEQRWQALESVRQALYQRASENSAATVAQLKQAAQPFSRDPQLQGQALAYLTTIDGLTEQSARAELERMYNEVVNAQTQAAQERDAAYQAALAQQAQAQQLYAQGQPQYQPTYPPQVVGMGAPRIEDPLADIELLGIAAE